MAFRMGLATLGGSLITMGLFYFMAALISADQKSKLVDGSHYGIEFIRTKSLSDLNIRNRKLPKKPLPPKKQPRIQRLKVASIKSPIKPKLNMDLPRLKLPSSVQGGAFLGKAGAGAQDSELMPLIRVDAQYPRKAAMNSIEGWVALRFDVTLTGTVENVKVLKSQPGRIFNSSARRAVLKYRYKPKIVDGKAVRQNGQQIVINFSLKD